MAKLTFELDTDEIYKEYNYAGDEVDGNSFESLIKHAIGKEVKLEMQSKFSGDAFDRTSKNIALECVHQVDKKLRSLINEDIVMQDRWGKAEFIGSVEDYIKKTIDEKLLHPVDTNGHKIKGCSSNADVQTWIEWSVENAIENIVKKVIHQQLQTAERYADRVIKDKIIEFKNKTLNTLITEKLASIGAY